MLDTVQIPILLKAIDFVFEEGRKILQERRERRMAEGSLRESREQKPAKEIAPPEPEQAIELRQDLRSSKVDEILWKNHEQEIDHLVKLWETYSRNYQLAREQYAKWGSALVPPIVVHNLTEAENSMIETIRQLQAILSKVYKKNLPPIE
jgi:hypothetical protein